MEEIPRKGPGRPRKVVPDAASAGEIQGAPSDDGQHGEIAFHAADPSRTPAPSRWAELIAEINRLSELGLLVTQVHTRDNRSGFYETDYGNAIMHGNAEDDYLVTSDGLRHSL